MQQASVETVSNLIGAVYDCVIAPECWSRVLDEICSEFGFATGALSVARLADMSAGVNAVSGSDLAQMSQNAVSYGADIIELWGGAARIQQYPLGEPIVQSQAVAQEVISGNRYYREWALPKGLFDAVAVGLVRDRMMVGNAIFSQHESAGDPIVVRHGRIAVQSAATTATLQSAVALAAKDEATLGQKGIGIPLPRPSGDPLVIHVLPLRRGPMRSGLIQRAAAALFVASAAGPPQLPRDALNQLYDLTPAEIRIFELICEGQTRADISSLLGISVSTVKSHLLHVFEKTGCRRQVDLVRLAKSLTFPV